VVGERITCHDRFGIRNTQYLDRRCRDEPGVSHFRVIASTDQGGGKRRAVTQRPVPLVTFRDLNVHEIGKG
jgi:hypothetical protein